MKILEKITLIIYSNIMLILSIVLCLLVFGWLDIGLVGDMVRNAIQGEVTGNVILGISVVFILLSIKCIFFDSTSKEQIKERQGVLLENESGKLMISKETIENLVNSVVQDFESAQEVVTRVELDKENNVRVYANLIVSSNAVIKELSANLQEKIKDKVKKATDLEVKEVNITVKKSCTKTRINIEIKEDVLIREEQKMEGFKSFWSQYKGAIIGILIAILVLITRLHDLILAIFILALGAIVGNYVQQNKEDVKTKLKKFIDRM